MKAKLEEKRYSYLQNPLYKGKLTNGLTVYLLPRLDFHESYGLLTCHFGSVDTIFKRENQEDFTVYPAGIAHFLEHKLFEMTDGQDLLQEFSKLGADTNAYTGFNQTSYLFSTAQDALQPLELLQKFIEELSFSEESLEKEKEIIAKEIEMYQDDPDSRLYTEILASLYPNSPLEKDIAGSIPSIQEITGQSLRENFEAFYQPDNMTLFLVGNFELEKAWQLIQSIQEGQASCRFKIIRQELQYNPVLLNRSTQMEVASPKLAIGVRGNSVVNPQRLYRHRVALSLFFSMLFGWTSKRHQDLYEKGKIDSSFSFHLEVRPEYHFFVMTLDTKEPIALSNSLRKAIKNFEGDLDISEEHLSIIKKEAYGDFIRSQNSLEYTASHFMQYLSDWETIFDLPEILESIELEEVLTVGRKFVSDCDMTDFIIFPK